VILDLSKDGADTVRTHDSLKDGPVRPIVGLYISQTSPLETTMPRKYSPHGFSLYELMLVVAVLGIVTALAVPNYQVMQARAREADVMHLAHLVQLATEDFAARNDGIYSDQAADIVPCLPGGRLQKNPFTGERTEPQFAAPAATPGQVGLEAIRRPGLVTGYVVSGFGRDEEVVRFLAGR
jgi:prepilin-type N-terminal cleavage/methylation domain-containing protein